MKPRTQLQGIQPSPGFLQITQNLGEVGSSGSGPLSPWTPPLCVSVRATLWTLRYRLCPSFSLHAKPVLPPPEMEGFTAEERTGGRRGKELPTHTAHMGSLRASRHQTSTCPPPAGPPSLLAPVPCSPPCCGPSFLPVSGSLLSFPIPSCLTPSRPFFEHPDQPGAYRAN